MNTEIQDLRVVVKAAARKGRNVAMGGHSLGGSIATAYATWDFNGRPGGKDLSGLVLIDGASSPTPVTADQASTSLATCRRHRRGSTSAASRRRMRASSAWSARP